MPRRVLTGVAAIAVGALAASMCAARAAHALPRMVERAYAGVEPAAIRKSLSRCRGPTGIVFKISWSTGYEGGELFLSKTGQELGRNLWSDVGVAPVGYNDRPLRDCVVVKQAG